MNHKIIFTEDKMFVNGNKVKDYKKSLPKEYGINYEDDLPKGTKFICKKCGSKLEYDINREEDIWLIIQLNQITGKINPKWN